MAQQSSWKKILVTTIIFTLISGGAAYANPTAGDQGIQDSVAAASEEPAASEEEAADAGSDESAAVVTQSAFSDVKSGHWAEKHISKLALQGIVKGLNGEFRPSDSVTRQEAVLMAVRFMGLEGELREDAAVVFPDAFQVGNAFKSAVILAFQEGLLDRDEEFRLAGGDASASWGSEEASREWITKLIVRAIGQQAEAQALSGAAVPFDDASEVDAAYVGYVNAAVELELVNGVTPDLFQPKGLINRAQLATMISRAQSQYSVSYAGQSTGIIAGIDDQQITLYDSDGNSVAYEITPQTLFFRSDSEQAATIASIQPFTEAMVIGGEGNALYVEQIGRETMIETIEGTIASVDEENRQVYLRIGNDFERLELDMDQLVIQEGKGESYRLSDLAEGSRVDVQRDTFRTISMAVRIDVKGAPVNRSGEGTIVAVEPGKITIREGETEREWSVSTSAAIKRGDAASGFGELAPGDAIAYTIENDLVTEISIESSADRTIAGQFSGVSADGKAMTYTVNGKLEANFIANGVKVVIEGIANAGLSDLTADDMLAITLSGDGYITAIEVTNRDVEIVNGATILNYDEESNVLTVQTTSGRPLAWTLSDKTRMVFNGKEMTMAAAETMLDKDRKVSVSYSAQDAIRVEIINRYNGVIMNLNASANQITIKLADESTLVLPLQSPAVQIYGDSSPSLSDLATGDEVTLLLNSAMERVITIQAHTVHQQTIAAVDTKGNKISLIDGNGKTSNSIVGSEWNIADESGKAIPLADLAAGQTVNVTYVGSQIAGLKVVDVTVGVVEAIGSNAITVAEYDGGTRELTVGSDYTVVKNGAASTLAVGDRAVIGKDERGRTVVTVIAGVTKQFWKYDAAANEIHVKRASTNDNNYKFKLTPDTLITSGQSDIDVSSLRLDDSIQLIIHNGKLLEVVKL